MGKNEDVLKIFKEVVLLDMVIIIFLIKYQYVQVLVKKAIKVWKSIPKVHV